MSNNNKISGLVQTMLLKINLLTGLFFYCFYDKQASQ
jgi:hypothetical protein